MRDGSRSVRPTSKLLRTFALALAAAGMALGTSAAPAIAAPCTRVASPNGSDSGAGTEAQPFRSVQRLVDALGGGQTGCLRHGTFSGNVKFSKGGSAGAPVTLTSYPGERATIVGKFWIADSANFVTIASLNLDGRNSSDLPSPEINGDDVVFADNDVTNQNSAICFNLGATDYGRAHRTVIERNRIHNCGRLPATNKQHGIYVEHASNVKIIDNVIVNNADRGVQLYPDAQGTYVARNVIDSNGVGFLFGGGDEGFGPQASSGNVVERNVITNSTQHYNVQAYWGSWAVGQNNVLRENCIYGGIYDRDNHGLGQQTGFVAQGNSLADPLFVDRAAGNYALRADSPCLRVGQPDPPPAPRESKPSAQWPVKLISKPPSLRPGVRMILKGRVRGHRRHRARRVVIQVRRDGRWRRVTRKRVKRGHFKSKPRLRVSAAASRRGKRHGAAKLVLKRARLSGKTRVLRLRAVVPGVGRSNVVHITVRR
jgi:parallel beta-helix repeat protein